LAIRARHPVVKGVSNSYHYVKLLGGNVVHATAFEPDPNTFRQDYYYNVVSNSLYKKKEVSTGHRWKRISL